MSFFKNLFNVNGGLKKKVAYSFAPFLIYNLYLNIFASFYLWMYYKKYGKSIYRFGWECGQRF